MEDLDGGLALTVVSGSGSVNGEAARDSVRSDTEVLGSLVGGEFERMLDEKGRITIPPRIRAALGVDYVTARGVEASVLVIPAALWPEVEASLNENLDGDENRYLRFSIHNRSHTSLDRQGRLKLPKHLLEWASLAPGDAAAIIATGRKFEIWNRRAWLRFSTDPSRSPAVDTPADVPKSGAAAVMGGGRK
jgi:MraZ protein